MSLLQRLIRASLQRLIGASLQTKILLLVFFGVGGYVVYLRHENTRLAEAMLKTDLGRLNAEAQMDVTRKSAKEIQAALRDSLVAFERLVVQTRERADALDKAAKRESKLRAALELKMRSFDSTVVGAVSADSNDVRHGIFGTDSLPIYSAPYAVAADVYLPRPPAEGQMSLRIRLDAPHLKLRAQCGAPDEFGVRKATFLLAVPRWITPVIDTVSQDDQLCMPPPKAPARVKAFGLGAVVGAATTAALFLLKVL